MLYKILFISIIFLSCYSCNKQDKIFKTEINGRMVDVLLKQYADSIYELQLFVDDSLKSTWKLNYPVYQFHCGDVDNDSVADILVGTIKPTRYYTTADKRLFIFKITDDYYIRPMWLGSRVSQPLIDFCLKEEYPISKIRTIEKEEDGTYLVAEYRWRGFGLDFIHYLHRNITLNEAEATLNKD